MPPRIQSRRVSNALLPLITSSSSSVSSIPSLCSSSQIILRQFSVTSAPQTKLRRAMFEWLNSEGVALKHHIPGETNYLRDSRAPRDSSKSRPFPNNPFFYSDSVLSEELRNEVYSQVVEKKKTVRSVSVQFRIDMRRVAAVVRLVEMERRQQAEVSISFSSLHSPSTHMMSQQNRLVLKTRASPDWLNFLLSLIFFLSTYSWPFAIIFVVDRYG